MAFGHRALSKGGTASADAVGRCHSPAGAAVIVHSAGSVMGWRNATSHSYRLPAQTCHRQLYRRCKGGTICSTRLSVRRVSRRTFCDARVRHFSVSIRKGQGDLWQFTIWRPRWLAGVQGAPPWPLPPI